jgi:[acyl-carrier-protein] S-malonyltransferase
VKKTAWLFPGQGAQTVGMGKALSEAFPVCREVFARADAALGWSLTRLCFEGPEAELMLTAHAQPAILTVSYAALCALQAEVPDLPDPDCAAGHSLGEYTALVAAGALTFENAVRLVHLRGKAMQRAVSPGQGAMAAVMGGDAELVGRICRQASQDGEMAAPANFNAPGQIVVAGHAGAVERTKSLCAGHGLKAIPLKVSAPFHCSLMAPAAKAVEEALRGLDVATPRFAVVSNVEAEANQDPSRIPALLVRQVDSPVLWEQSIRTLAARGVQQALELGPGKVLAGLVKRTQGNLRVLSVGDPGAVERAKGEFAEPGGS